jgi:hypothetical protein
MTEKLIIKYLKDVFNNDSKKLEKAYEKLKFIIPKSSKEKIIKEKKCTFKSLYKKKIVSSVMFGNCTFVLVSKTVYNLGTNTQTIKYQIYIIDTERGSYDIYKPIISKIL